MTQTLADHLVRLNHHTRRCWRRRGWPMPEGVPAVLLLTDARRGDPVRAAQGLPVGAGVLLRHYGDPGREDLAQVLAGIARRRGLRLLLAVTDPGTDIALAERVGAAGLHLPERLARHGLCAAVLRWRAVRAGRLLTVAAHSPLALRRAVALRADAALLSPVFPTASHPGAPVLGALLARQWGGCGGLLGRAPPVLALGGVNSHSVKALTGSGLWGGAAISGLAADR